MKLIVFLTAIMLFSSCEREVPARTATIEGDYTDTTRYIHPAGAPIAYPDTIVKKTVYKINDSTFWMVGFRCNDSTTLCGNFSTYYKLGFIIKSNNSVQTFEFGSAVPPLPPLAAASYYDPVNRFIYIVRCPDVLCDRKEVHRMSRL